MFYKNARIFTSDFRFVNGAFEVRGNRFGAVLPDAVPDVPDVDVQQGLLFLIAFIFRKSRDKSFGFHDDCFAS